MDTMATKRGCKAASGDDNRRNGTMKCPEFQRKVCSNLGGIYDGCISTESIVVGPEPLTQYDVVICSYNTLRREIHNTEIRHHNLRREKVHRVCPSPLTQVHWWRLVLDEAQLVVGYGTAAKMAKKLKAFNRWCVTGSPFVRSVPEEFLGLLCAVSPNESLLASAAVRTLFSLLSRRATLPLEAMCVASQNNAEKRLAVDTKSIPGQILNNILRLVGPMFWRTKVCEATAFINFPPISYHNILLDFNPVEKYYYHVCLPIKILLRCKHRFVKFVFKILRVTGFHLFIF